MLRRDRTWRAALTLSLAVHGGVLAFAFWKFHRLTLPRVALAGGSGGDGIQRGGAIWIPADASSVVSHEMPPASVDPIDVPTESPSLEIPEAKGGEVRTDATPLMMSDSTAGDGWFGPSSRADRAAHGGSVPKVQRELPGGAGDGSASAPGEASGTTIGWGGLGGDGFATAQPNPSARNRPPRYPAESRRQGHAGTVLLEVEVLATGKVGHISVITSSGHNLLDDAAVEAVKSWQFEPAITEGKHVGCYVRLPVQFILRGS